MQLGNVVLGDRLGSWASAYVPKPRSEPAQEPRHVEAIQRIPQAASLNLEGMFWTLFVPARRTGSGEVTGRKMRKRLALNHRGRPVAAILATDPVTVFVMGRWKKPKRPARSAGFRAPCTRQCPQA